jgi:thioredoxin-like negative regulator of GroEL
VFGPVFEKSSEANADVVFDKLNTEDQPALATTFGIQAIPTLMAFRDGILIFEQAGALPGHALQKLIDEIKALDMAEVRAKVDDQAKRATAGTGGSCCG